MQCAFVYYDGHHHNTLFDFFRFSGFISLAQKLTAMSTFAAEYTQDGPEAQRIASVIPYYPFHGTSLTKFNKTMPLSFANCVMIQALIDFMTFLACAMIQKPSNFALTSLLLVMPRWILTVSLDWMPVVLC